MLLGRNVYVCRNEEVYEKKLFSVLLVGALAASLVACGKTEKKEAKASTANTEINAEEYAGTITSNAGVYKTFVNLSDWKGMSVDLKESDYVVLDSDVEDYIKSMLESKATTNVITEGTTKAGDVIKLDYSGKLDGTAFSGGTATDVTYTIGSGKFIEDLDKGLVGLTVGQRLILHVYSQRAITIQILQERQQYSQ